MVSRAQNVRSLLVVVGFMLWGATACPPDEPPPAPPECTTVDGCGAGRVCARGACTDAPTCIAVDDWPYCAAVFDELEPDLGRTAVCEPVAAGSSDHLCRVACETDDACLPGSLCTDFGVCVPGLVREPRGTPRRAHAPLLAGVGEALLEIPLTTSLGGYSSRAGPGDNAWADGMSAAVGRLEGLWARAAALDVGDGRLLLVRLPTIFPTGALTEAIAHALEQRTGDDWRDALVVHSTHTHSGPARFLPLLSESEAILGPFGIGTFRQEIFDQMVEASVAAALAALETQEPARLAWTIVEAFDTDDAIAQDRRSQSPPFDDNRALLVRVDDEAGVPMFVVTGFGVHPTDNTSDWATNDLPGGVERALEEALHEEAGRVVPVLFVNGAGGSMGPAGGRRGFAVPHSADAVGREYATRVLPELLALETRADIALDARAHRFPLTTEVVGYKPGEWVNPGEPPFGGDVKYGGFNCFALTPDDGDVPYSDHRDPKGLACLVAFHTFLFNHPPSVFQRSQISAVQLDGLSMLTIPGELTMELGWGVVAALQREAGVDPLSAFTLGYSNDHLMYLLPTLLDEDAPPWPGYEGLPPRSYPPYAYSPLRGGYEADTSIYGDKFGDVVVKEAVVAWQRLVQGAPPSVEAAPSVYSPVIKPPIPVLDTPEEQAGALVTPLPPTLPRRTPATMTFVGGDVAVERQGPLVALVHDGGAPVLLPSGRPFTTEHTLFPLSVVLEDGAWLWSVTLELPHDLPLDRYHLEVSGRVQRDGAVVPYTFETSAFEVTPAELTVSAAREGDALVVRVGHATDVPNLDEPLPVGRLRLLDHRVPSGVLAPLSEAGRAGAVVRLSQGAEAARTAVLVEEMVDEVPASVARFEGVAPGALEVEVTDAFGNVGRLELAAEEP